jgi:alginate O-acetyltransferase complex protein AlgJ
MTREPIPRAAEVALVVILAIVLAAPLADTWLHLDPVPALQEKRRLAAWPPSPRGWEAVAAWPWSFDQWLDDHLGLRASLTMVNAWLRLRLVGASVWPNAPVLVGREGWLYYTGDGELDNALRRDPLTPDDLQTWCRSLEEARRGLEARGGRLLLVLVPDKSTTMAEHLPSWVRHRGLPSRAEALLGALAARTRVDVVDVRGTLEEAKTEGRVFLKTDTHWTDRGAHAGYVAIVQHLRDSFGSVHPVPLSGFRVERTRQSGMDLAMMMGASSFLTEDVELLLPRRPRQARVVESGPDLVGVPNWLASRVAVTERPGAEIARVVMIGDSFADALRPFLLEHFGRTVFLPREVGFPWPVIEREHPDLVILELVERNLSHRPPMLPLAPGVDARPDEAAGTQLR